MPNPDTKTARPLLSNFWFWLVVLTIFRIMVLVISPSDLGPDEAQYWFWSRDLAFGYFSKPPLIAWAIAATTGVFGNDEWAVRLSAPLFHAGAASFLYLTAKRHLDAQTAFWTGLGWLTIPGVILSSFVITTDAPLLFFWSAAIFLVFNIVADRNRKLISFACFGAVIGLGFLSKYAMLYFVAALFIAFIVSRPVRSAFTNWAALLTPGLALAFATPNILWNVSNNFQTVAHTAANANWRESLFAFPQLFSFWAEQAAVVGIIPFFGLIWLAIRYRSYFRTLGSDNWKQILLFIFALTPLAIVSLQAFISRAHANWAVAAYPAAILLVTAWFFAYGRGVFIKASVSLHSFFVLVFSVGVLNFSPGDRLHLSSATKTIRGWEQQSSMLAKYAPGFDAIAIDDRSLIGEMLYYQRNDGLTVAAYNANIQIDNHFEAVILVDPHKYQRILFVTTRTDSAHVDHRFDDVSKVGQLVVQLGPGVSRQYTLYAISGYHR